MRSTLLGIAAACLLAGAAIAPGHAMAAQADAVLRWPLLPTTYHSTMPSQRRHAVVHTNRHARSPHAAKQHLSKGVSRVHHTSAHAGTATAAGVTPSKAQMLALINAERAKAGVAPLSFDGTLNAIAQARSQDMIDRHYFAHQIPSAPSMPGVRMVFDILDHDNVQYQMAGENIALNNYSAFYPLAQTVQQTNTDLMNSPEHKANILEPKYARIGIGLAFEQGTGKLILTEDFVQP